MSKPKDETADTSGQDADVTENEEHLDEMLDEALEDTFPASDPVAVTPGKDDPEPPGA